MKITPKISITAACGCFAIFLIFFYSTKVRRFALSGVTYPLTVVFESTDSRVIRNRLSAAMDFLSRVDEWIWVKSGQATVIQISPDREFQGQEVLDHLKARSIKEYQIRLTPPPSKGSKQRKLIMIVPTDRADEIRSWLNSLPIRKADKS